MASIIKKGSNPTSFQLSKKEIICRPDIIVPLTNDEFDELMKKYGWFIGPRIITEKHPNGFFVVNKKKSNSYTKDMSKEVGKIKDGSSRKE